MEKFKFVNLFLRKSHDLVMGFDKSFDPTFKEPQRYMRRRKPISEGNFLTKKVGRVWGESPRSCLKKEKDFGVVISEVFLWNN